MFKKLLFVGVFSAAVNGICLAEEVENPATPPGSKQPISKPAKVNRPARTENAMDLGACEKDIQSLCKPEDREGFRKKLNCIRVNRDKVSQACRDHFKRKNEGRWEERKGRESKHKENRRKDRHERERTDERAGGDTSEKK